MRVVTTELPWSTTLGEAGSGNLAWFNFPNSRKHWLWIDEPLPTSWKCYTRPRRRVYQQKRLGDASSYGIDNKSDQDQEPSSQSKLWEWRSQDFEYHPLPRSNWLEGNSSLSCIRRLRSSIYFSDQSDLLCRCFCYHFIQLVDYQYYLSNLRTIWAVFRSWLSNPFLLQL